MKKLWKIFEEKEGFLRSESWLHFATFAIGEMVLCLVILPLLFLTNPHWIFWVVGATILFYAPVYLGVAKENRDEKKGGKFDKAEAIYSISGAWGALIIVLLIVAAVI